MNHCLHKNDTNVNGLVISYPLHLSNTVTKLVPDVKNISTSTLHGLSLTEPEKSNNGNGHALSEKSAAAIAIELLKLPDQHSDWLRWVRLTKASAAILAFPCGVPDFANGAKAHVKTESTESQVACDLLIIAAYSSDNALGHLVGTRVKISDFPPHDITAYLNDDNCINQFNIQGDGVLVLVEPAQTRISSDLAHYWLDAFNIALEKTAERQNLEQAKRAATELSLAKSRFLSMMSYEIRTPMNAIMGMTELLLDTTLDAQQREFAMITYDSSEALLQILGDVVDYAKLESSGLDMDYAPFVPKDTVNSTLKMLSEKVQGKGLALNPAFAVGLPSLVLGDAGRVRQMLLNLVLSIIKFTNTGSVIIRVSHVESTATTAMLRFDVRSPAAQIPEDMREYLLSPFSTRETATSRQYIGVRLALSVAAKLAQLMKGEFKMEATKPTGWVFSFTATFGLQTIAP